MQSLRAAFRRRTPIFLKPYEFSTNVFGLRCRYYSQVRHNGALTDLEYHRVADDTLDVLNDTFEDLLEEVGKKDYDIQYANGVITLMLGEKGTYVINKQPPAHQIWLSSPVSGPKHYEYSLKSKTWCSTRDEGTLLGILSSEFSKWFSRPIEFKKSEDF
ncbi:mitochondrial [2Fe-2S] cluster assembly frataxin Fxn1 [Schizosaccharomyces pombe]|uniref:Frataxin homolog, mitochondrial n=1 Tax=Schizosaccharomyces pombe (strain 972 / ATCC 24843) TaxID=284812 RepID=FRDA_SCHPO|nr:frataxin [Schizosaccharomyces pombe]O74831.1 RecName: Full=Frataxin homolog, mitochondrial; Flags: Precursor [Schizosaccharomyces pombe 972h-]CAA21083.1 frataxin (predicted) [Schizosaccharomyces pombe]|eukprot:NP_587886.1 frataxin [Schizosaccharomyces pombe]